MDRNAIRQSAALRHTIRKGSAGLVFVVYSTLGYKRVSLVRESLDVLQGYKGKLTFTTIDLPLSTIGEDGLSVSSRACRCRVIDCIRAVVGTRSDLIGLLVIAHVANFGRGIEIHRNAARLSGALRHAIFEIGSRLIEEVRAGVRWVDGF